MFLRSWLTPPKPRTPSNSDSASLVVSQCIHSCLRKAGCDCPNVQFTFHGFPEVLTNPTVGWTVEIPHWRPISQTHIWTDACRFINRQTKHVLLRSLCWCHNDTIMDCSKFIKYMTLLVDATIALSFIAQPVQSVFFWICTVAIN